jgi:AcrR family transcriptional regulator
LPRPKQRTAQLRDHVLRAARALLESEGVEGFTARSIARQAGTSMPAMYELFGDKAGLMRALFFEGFRALRRQLDQLEPSPHPRADMERAAALFRAFVQANPVLSDLMFSQPFASFDPGPAEQQAGGAVREFLVSAVRRCIDARLLSGDATDIAHVLVALVQGLAAQERAGWLGSSKASVDRRWRLGIQATLDGMRGA